MSPEPTLTADYGRLREAARLVKNGIEDQEIHTTKPINRALLVILDELLNDGPAATTDGIDK